MQARKAAGIEKPDIHEGLLTDVSIKDIEAMKQSNQKGEER